MKAARAPIEDKVDQLLVYLDRDARHIQESLQQLNEMRRLVIKRDEAALGRLLENIQGASDCHRDHELNRKSIRKDLADRLCCNVEQITLSALESCLPEAKKDRVTQMKAKLRSLTAELKKEYLSTALLLSECARFNNMLLKGIFDLGKTESIHYKSNGETRRHIDTAFVNLQI